jgi:uncharacterized membrane protein YfcA
METVFSSLAQFAAVCLLLACAEAVYVTLGFGAGLIAVGTLALILPELRDVVVLLLLVNIPAELYVVIRSRRHIVWSKVAVIFIGIGVGIPIGTWILKVGDPSAVLTALGAFLVVVGAIFLVGRFQRRRDLPWWTTPPVGLSSGLLTGLFGTGGPPLILYYQLVGVDKASFRGNLMAIFLLMSTVRVPSYIAFDLVTAPRIWSSIAVFPAVLLGAVIGNSIHLRLSEETFRRVVSASLVVIGVLLLVRQVT